MVTKAQLRTAASKVPVLDDRILWSPGQIREALAEVTDPASVGRCMEAYYRNGGASASADALFLKWSEVITHEQVRPR